MFRLLKNTKRKAQTGFTLVELMIVIAIIGILAAAALQQFNSYRQRGKASKLIDFARGCAMERMSDCQKFEGDDADPSLTPIANLPTCNPVPGTFTLIPGNEPITTTGGGTCGSITVQSTASVGGVPYTSTCSGVWNTSIRCDLTP